MQYVVPFTVSADPARGTIILDLVYEGESIVVEYAPDDIYWDASDAATFVSIVVWAHVCNRKRSVVGAVHSNHTSFSTWLDPNL